MSDKLPARVREEWDIRYSDGTTEHLTIVPDQGDTAMFDPEAPFAVFSLAERPSPADPDTVVPGEDVFVALYQVRSVRRRVRRLTREEMAEQDLLARMMSQMPRSTIQH